LTRVLLHRVVQEIVNRTFELASHLLEAAPQRLATLKGSGGLSVVGHEQKPSGTKTRALGRGQHGAITAYQV
jgi:hypothetical protein